MTTKHSSKKLRACAAALVWLVVLAGCSPVSDPPTGDALGRFRLDDESLQQWKLPKKLKEISGLVVTPDGRLFAVCDERAVIYELDFRGGAIVKAFSLGDPPLSGDFEGIAVLDDVFYIVTSKGDLYATAEGKNDDQMTFARYETGIGKRCEVEGLAEDVRAGTLLLACKQATGSSDELPIFSWSPATGGVVSEVAVPVRQIAQKLGKKRISPSGVVIDPDTGHLYVVAARQRALIEMKPTGELIDAIILPAADRHRQPEGIAISREGELLIADEGGKKKARLGIYAPSENMATSHTR